MFNRQSISSIGIQSPQPSVFQPIPSGDMLRDYRPVAPNPNLILNQFGSNAQDQNRRNIQEAEAIINRSNQAQLDEVRRDLMEEKFYREHIEWLEKSKYYRGAFQQLLDLNPDSFSIAKAVYIVENAFLENKYSFNEFQSRLQLEAKIIQQQLKADKLNTNDNTALNYGIQKRFRIGGQYYDPKKKATVTIKPFKYDFQDYMGEKDYRQMFVTKMLITGKGQCHSMPLTYLMIAEQLGAKAWLSLAPEHSFIRFLDTKGNLLNFETTSGGLVSTNWLHQSGYINAAALKNRVYLDTLSQKDLYAQCLGDLLQGYLKKFDYDDFAEAMRQRMLQLNPQNLTALMIEANIKRVIAWNQILAAGKPSERDLPNYPAAYQAYLAMQAAYDKVDGMGFQEMPPEAYQKWLKSIEQEKKKQETLEIQRRLQREIEYMKKHKPQVIIRNKID
ncbi:MAG: hypothetical protein E6Q24_15210 [Chitinophagaceae bacterium]|nr:MAG: hypothetical protein E6Q24_15210 [Chitinophagaceae bacterium]